MTFKKTKLVLGIATATLTLGAALVSPQAMAHKSSKKHHHHTSTSHSSSSYSQTELLASQVRQLQDEVSALRSQQAAVAPVATADAAKVEELDQWMASVKAAPVIEKTKDNMMFFRGGYGRANATRGGTLDPTLLGNAGSANGLAVGSIADKDAWYMGAGFDFSINNNLFGLMDDTEVLTELMFDYKELGRRGNNGLSPAEVAVVNTLPGSTITTASTTTTTVRAANGTVVGVPTTVVNSPVNVGANTATGVTTANTTFNLPAANTKTATVNQFTLAASPKIKFLKGSAFRPWIIPVGFEINVVSPPSNAITVLSPGMQFGLGADYKVWKDLYIGADARYHQQLGSIDGVRTNGFTAGGYLGLGF
jgi:hypothetical protein